jgi:Leucine-rich repeat (LRR) protein
MTQLFESLQMNCSYQKIQELNLAGNFLNGTILTGIVRFVSLVTLKLQDNKLTSLVPLEISMLTNLTMMDLGSNDLHGVITEEHFAGLWNSRMIDLSYNQWEIAVGPQQLAPFIRLDDAYFASCNMGLLFPIWLKHLLDIDRIDISSSGLVFSRPCLDQLPDWFSTAFAKATLFGMSNNLIHGMLPKNFTRLDLSNNSFSGPLPSNF